jgi:hypothetical protein
VLVVPCPYCKEPLTVSGIDRQFRCPKCNGVLRIPDPTVDFSRRSSSDIPGGRQTARRWFPQSRMGVAIGVAVVSVAVSLAVVAVRIITSQQEADQFRGDSNQMGAASEQKPVVDRPAAIREFAGYWRFQSPPGLLPCIAFPSLMFISNKTIHQISEKDLQPSIVRNQDGRRVVPQQVLELPRKAVAEIEFEKAGRITISPTKIAGRRTTFRYTIKDDILSLWDISRPNNARPLTFLHLSGPQPS